MAQSTISRSEKRARVAQLIAAQPEASDRKIGRLAGVDGKTVAALRKLGAEIETPHTPQTPQRGIPHSTEIPHGAEIPQGQKLRSAEIKTPQRPNSFVEATPAAKIETPQGIRAEIAHYLATAPVEEIAAQVPRGPRRTALRNALRAAMPRHRVTEPLPGNNWRHRTTPEQRQKLLELVATGMTVMDASIQAGLNYGTARSQITAAQIVLPPRTPKPKPEQPEEWRYATSDEQRIKLRELVESGKTVTDAALEVGMNYSTARSQIQKARREMGRAA
jgi:molybdenum-dependent DNA-binding transcriptional regulator ModE